MIRRKIVIIASVIFLNTCAFAQTTIPANDAKIQYIGRIDFTNPLAPTFAFPGVSIKAKFQGTSISANLTEYGAGGVATTNYFNVIIDGGTPVVLKLAAAQTTYELASGLVDTEHTIELFKRTEASVGKVAFKGFVLENGKALVEAEALSKKRIEFIGNSITCGYGNESSTNPPKDGFSSVNENNYNAWGAVTARNIDAQYMCTAYSGRGLVRNNTGSTSGVASQFYNRIFPDEGSSTWNHQNYKPHIIVINLGTNDFAAEVSNAAYTVEKTDFQNGYKEFISTLRSHHADAKIICAVGVMMSDYYPVGASHWTRIQDYVSTMVDDVNNGGDKNVFYFKMNPQVAPYGEDWHPTAATDVKMANGLTDFINEKINWDEVLATVGDEVSSSKSIIQTSPNPFSESLTLEVKSIENHMIQVRIIDALGNVRLSESIMTNKPFKLGENLINGIYYIETIEGGDRIVAKVIKN